MKKIILFFSFLPFLAIAQFSDDFSDGDFVQDPVWIGTTENFIVNDNYQLQLMDDEASSSYLATSQMRLDSTEWLLEAKLQFSPSSNNYARVFLATNAASPDLATEGIYLQLGESGSDDALTLFYFNGDETTQICRGSDGLISASFDLKIKIVRNSSGVWRIYIDTLNNGMYVLHAEGVFEQLFSSSYFLLQCIYTISNSEKFYFDNMVVRAMQVDTEAPEVVAVTVESENALSVVFSEAVERESASDRMNYEWLQGIYPTEVVFNEITNDQVQLIFSTPFPDQELNFLAVSGVKDFSGNEMEDSEHAFIYIKPYLPAYHDIVISELMVDVNPEPNGLPVYDYIELYNRTENLIDLSGVTISWGSQLIEFQDEVYIQPESYLLLADDDADYGEEVAVYNFSSLTVNNEATMVLRDSAKQIIHALAYEKSWYHDVEKQEGGWSLEMIDVNNPCGGINNYSASINLAGGTPGVGNSVMANNPDNVAPEIKNVVMLNDFTLHVLFSESMDTVLLSQFDQYMLKPLDIYPVGITLNSPIYDEVTLSFDQNLNSQQVIYELILGEQTTDCAGNSLLSNTFSFSNYQPVYGDIVITEIMADVNPAPRDLPEVEYLEIYNRSAYPVNLEELKLVVGTSEISFPESAVIPSNAFRVISTDALDVDNTIVVSSLSISNTGADVYLADANGQIIHHVGFALDWFGDDVKEEGGYSLEMVDVDRYCLQKENWIATNAFAGGTPGMENSVAGEIQDHQNPDIRYIIAESENQIILQFDEKMNPESLSTLEGYSFTPGIMLIGAEGIPPAYDQVLLTFATELSSEQDYDLMISDEVVDCEHNEVVLADAVAFSYPLSADTNDLVINEVLFYAEDETTDFVEIYNVSGHAIDLSTVFFATLDPLTAFEDKKMAFSNDRLILLKDKYLAIADDDQLITSYYEDAPQRNILENEAFPNLSSTEGLLQLQTLDGSVIEEMSYSEEMHFELIDDYKGVSLERIDPYSLSTNESNWHSASGQSNYATPGLPNSQLFLQNNPADEITVAPTIMTPNSDGVDDVASLDIVMNENGYAANVMIYDRHGREIILLVNNQILGATNRFFWDGKDANNNIVPSGHYIFYVELFDMEGNSQHEKVTVIVVR